MSRHFDKGEENRGDKKREDIIQIQSEGELENFEDLEFMKWQKELLNDEDWCATLVRFSGNATGHLAPAQRRLQGGARAQFPPKRFQAI